MDGRDEVRESWQRAARDRLGGPLGRRLRGLAPWAVFMVIFGCYPLVFQTSFGHNLGILICLTALLGTGWNLLGGVTGQVSFGHALFFGIGAYATTLANIRFGLNPWLGLVIGAIIAAAVAVLVGLPVLRLRGHYFAIATIAFGQIGFLIFLNTQWLEGARGITLPVEDDSLVRFQFGGILKFEYYYIIFALLFLALLATRVIARSRLGYYLGAIREDQDAAASIGVPVARYKEIAFAISAAIVAIGGGFLAQYVLFVDPFSTLSLNLSIEIALAAILGGTGSLWGPVIGGALIELLDQLTRRFIGGVSAINLVVFGLLVMVLAAFEPDGVIGLVRRLRRRLSALRRRRSRPDDRDTQEATR